MWATWWGGREVRAENEDQCHHTVGWEHGQDVLDIVKRIQHSSNDVFILLWPPAGGPTGSVISWCVYCRLIYCVHVRECACMWKLPCVCFLPLVRIKHETRETNKLNKNSNEKWMLSEKKNMVKYMTFGADTEKKTLTSEIWVTENRKHRQSTSQWLCRQNEAKTDKRLCDTEPVQQAGRRCLCGLKGR